MNDPLIAGIIREAYDQDDDDAEIVDNDRETNFGSMQIIIDGTLYSLQTAFTAEGDIIEYPPIPDDLVTLVRE